MLHSVFALILSAIHLLYSAWTMMKHSWIFVVRQYKSAVNNYSGKEELNQILNSVKRLNKIPAHLAIIIVNEKISYNDLANIVIWCIAARISCLSLYDHTGVLKKNEVKLHAALLEKWKEPPVIWGKAPLKNGISKGNGYSNGVSSNADRNIKEHFALQVLLLAPNEGREAFTTATRHICDSVLSGVLKVSSINEEFFEEELRLGTKEKPIFDPELAVWCGKYCCNCGFLPWHIRVTQFLHLNTHHDVRIEDFFSLLEKYSKCEQRFGK
ncbi:dehydrodolichyl diphosphate synthase complex subunit nus1 [Ischnura elegans]|uniref:dehydrodolichyl diphosphate synthase complex subunit nus1 n=1 Tax=Ischnura elegans TaxID=197161 RepID=UPI001ED8A3C8|nr:dehydrodolichyl diphosphate synthase complex subunit nus1 [Ischnura elegans]